MQPIAPQSLMVGVNNTLDCLEHLGTSQCMFANGGKHFNIFSTAKILGNSDTSCSDLSFLSCDSEALLAQIEATIVASEAVSKQFEESTENPQIIPAGTTRSDLNVVGKPRTRSATAKEEFGMARKRKRASVTQKGKPSLALKDDLDMAKSQRKEPPKTQRDGNHVEGALVDVDLLENAADSIEKDPGELVFIQRNSKDLQDDDYRVQTLERQKSLEIERLTNEKAMMQDDLNRLQDALFRQGAQLQTCKDDLFRLRPSAQITDSEVAAKYGVLCDGVATWVEDELDRFEDQTLVTRKLSCLEAILAGRIC